MTNVDDPPDGRGAPAAPPRSAPSGPVGEGEHVVRSGEDLHSIAWRYGVDPRALWEHPSNAALRERRREGVLLPGDLVTVPAPRERASFAVRPGGSHRFSATVPRHELRLSLEEDGTPQANLRYTVVADGVTAEGTTDGQGQLVLSVRPSTRFVTLTLHEQEDGHPFDSVMRIELGGLDPGEDLTGVQARLRNLGHSPGPIDGELGPRTRRAIESFQRAEGLEPSGELDDATRERLAERHEH